MVMPATSPQGPATGTPIIEVRDLSIQYQTQMVLNKVSLAIHPHEIFGVIGPSNSGKTSFLKALNRMDDFTPEMRVQGTIYFQGQNIRELRNVYAFRRQIGVVFPLPVGLPLTIYENVAFAPRLAGMTKRNQLDEIVERCLRRAALWDEVKDRLNSLGSMLSGGQQQRLTIARALAQEPELLMLDEFSIAVDPVTTMRIEQVLKDLRQEMTVIVVTNLVQQAYRLADRTAFFLNGQCVEIGRTEDMFNGTVQNPQTLDYIEGRFG
jgi:phosphate transport system ATP-binding protein